VDHGCSKEEVEEKEEEEENPVIA